MTIADLICPETNKQALDSRPATHQVDSQASVPPNTFPPPQPQILQPSQRGADSVLQPSHQANSVQYLPASQHSSPWAFHTQLTVKGTTANQSQNPTLSRGLLEPFEPPTSSGNQDPSPSRQARSATPASNSLSASPPLSLREKLRRNRENIARRYSHRYSISRLSRDSSHVDGHSNEMDLSGASNVTSPVAAGGRDRLRESLNEPNSSGSQAATYDIAIGGVRSLFRIPSNTSNWSMTMKHPTAPKDLPANNHSKTSGTLLRSMAWCSRACHCLVPMNILLVFRPREDSVSLFRHHQSEKESHPSVHQSS